jgi:hypothetical protein
VHHVLDPLADSVALLDKRRDLAFDGILLALGSRGLALDGFQLAMGSGCLIGKLTAQ